MTTIDIQDREELIEQLEQAPLAMEELVADASDEDLTKAGPSGSLGAVEILSYVRDVEELFLGRLHQMIEDDNPRFERVEDSLWPIERDYVNRDPLLMLQEFDELRKQAVQVLLDLPISDWERLGRHPSHGQLTVRRYVERVVERDEEYIAQLKAVLGEPE
ncbi:MAG: DinB family protein [Thermomicrobiales bacterium]